MKDKDMTFNQNSYELYCMKQSYIMSTNQRNEGVCFSRESVRKIIHLVTQSTLSNKLEIV